MRFASAWLLLAGLCLQAPWARSAPLVKEAVDFAAMGDLHYVQGAGAPVADRAALALNAVPQLGWLQGPDAAAAFRGVLLLGDLTDDGLGAEFERFASVYGLNGEKSLRFPVMESFGNHDFTADRPGQRHGFGFDYPVMRAIAERHSQRATRPLRTGTAGGLYSWDWGPVHFVHLGLKAGGEQALIAKNGKPHRWTSGYSALDFLRADLAATPATQPIVIAMHYPPKAGARLEAAELDAFHRAIAKHHVVALLHAHTHQTGVGRWCGVPVFDVGSPQKPERGMGDFSIFRITADRLEAASVRWPLANPERLQLPGAWQFSEAISPDSRPAAWPCGDERERKRKRRSGQAASTDAQQLSQK